MRTKLSGIDEVLLAVGNIVETIERTRGEQPSYESVKSTVTAALAALPPTSGSEEVDLLRKAMVYWIDEVFSLSIFGTPWRFAERWNTNVLERAALQKNQRETGRAQHFFECCQAALDNTSYRACEAYFISCVTGFRGKYAFEREWHSDPVPNLEMTNEHIKPLDMSASILPDLAGSSIMPPSQPQAQPAARPQMRPQGNRIKSEFEAWVRKLYKAIERRDSARYLPARPSETQSDARPLAAGRLNAFLTTLALFLTLTAAVMGYFWVTAKPYKKSEATSRVLNHQMTARLGDANVL